MLDKIIYKTLFIPIYTQFYLENRKQYLNYNNDVSNLEQIKFGVQGSILRLLLFLIYVNDLSNASNILAPTMFADDTNLFLSRQKIKSLLKIFNKELQKLGTGSSRTNYPSITGKLNTLFFIKHLLKMIYL